MVLITAHDDFKELDFNQIKEVMKFTPSGGWSPDL